MGKGKIPQRIWLTSDLFMEVAKRMQPGEAMNVCIVRLLSEYLGKGEARLEQAKKLALEALQIIQGKKKITWEDIKAVEGKLVHLTELLGKPSEV